MHRFLLVTSILLVLASGQLYYQMRFRPDRHKLSKCIRAHDVFAIYQFYDIGIVRAIADSSAKRFQGKISDVECLSMEVTLMIQDLKNDWRYSQLRDSAESKEFWTELGKAAEVALMYCSEPLDDPGISEFPLPLPDFYREPVEVAAVLNFMLVEWPLPLCDMHRTRLGRSLLRRYAKDARDALDCALSSADSVGWFRTMVRKFWRLRAELYFDDSDIQNPYIPHRYNLANQFPFRYHRLNLFSRTTLSYQRNRPVSPELLNRILRIHVQDREGESDFYSEYERRGMHSADYHLETRVDQFYRVIFFVEEMEASGVRSDEDDVWDGPIPSSVMSNGVQVILYDDLAYGQYLLVRRSLEISLGNNRSLQIRNLRATARVWEENILALTRRHPFSSIGVIVANDSLTTTGEPMSTTSRYEDSSRVKTEPPQSPPGKCQSEQNDEVSSDGFSESGSFVDSCMQKRLELNGTNPVSSLCPMIRESRRKLKTVKKLDNKQYFGYVEQIEDLQNVKLQTEESSVLLKVLIDAIYVWKI